MSTCPRCSGQLKYIQQYGQWYCDRCGQYMQPAYPQGQYPQQQYPQGQYPQGQAQAPAQGVQPHAQPQAQPQTQPQVQPQVQTPTQPQQTRPNPNPNPGHTTTAGDLEYETVHAPSFSTLIFYLKQGQSVVAEKGAMMYMHRTVEIKTHGRKGGLIKGIMTSALGGESFFVNTFTATSGPGELAVVGPTMGDIRVIDVSKQPMILQSGAYLASAPNVNLDTKWQGLKGFLSEKDFVMLRASGTGNIWVSSFGGIIEMNLQPGETLSVDTGHLVAFPDNIQFNVRRVGGWKSTILSGEGLVTDLTGPGKVLMQTRHLPAFVQALLPFLPQQR